MKTLLLLATLVSCPCIFSAENLSDRDLILSRIVKCEDAVRDAKAKGDTVGVDVFTQQVNGLKKKNNVTEKEIADYRIRQTQSLKDDAAAAAEASKIQANEVDKEKLLIPSEQAKAESLKFIKEFYSDWYIGQPDKRAASTVLLDAAKNLNPEQNTLRYVLLTESVNFGVNGGNLRSGEKSLRILRGWGKRDYLSEECKFYVSINTNFPGGGDNWTPNDLMQSVIELTKEAHDAHRSDVELALYKLLEIQAKRRQDLDLMLKIQENIRDLEKQKTSIPK